MFKKTRLLAGLAIGCVLSAPTALAEEYKGFYFGVWGGAGSLDLGSRDALDELIIDALPEELFRAGFNFSDETQLVTFTLQDVGDSTLDDSLSVWGVQLGYRWNQYVATEVGYANLGQATYALPGSATFTVQTVDGIFDGLFPIPFERGIQYTSAGPTVTVLGMLPVGPRVDLHVRGGVYLADTRLTNRIRDLEEMQNLSHRRVDASETELLGGIGATWSATENLSLRAEYQRFFNVGDDTKSGEFDVDVFNLSVLFR